VLQIIETMPTAVQRGYKRERAEEDEDDHDSASMEENMSLLELLRQRKSPPSNSQSQDTSNALVISLDSSSSSDDNSDKAGRKASVASSSLHTRNSPTSSSISDFFSPKPSKRKSAVSKSTAAKNVVNPHVEILDLTQDDDDNNNDDGDCNDSEPLVSFGDTTQPTGPEENTCFICGTDLGSLKSRIAHVKRCSKKYGISLRDMGRDEYEEDGNDHNDEEDNNDDVDDNMNGENYDEEDASKIDAEDTILPADNDESTLALPINPYKRSTSTSSAEGNARSLASVLMAGAKRAAQLNKLEVDAQKADALKNKTPFGGIQSSFNSNNKRYKYSFGTQQGGNARFCPSFKMISYTDFCVDGFKYAAVANTHQFFLTHFHADHYGGITKNWKYGTIYCSHITASLVQSQLGVESHHLHPLPLFQPITLTSKGQSVTVTLLDANHCPGSVMFLFQIGEKYILHVGDFRWNRAVMQAQAPLLPFLQKEKKLETLYLDTTYCNEKYTLPSQQVTIDETIRTVEEQLRQVPFPNLLFIFGSYSIGKERIYMAVAEHLNCKVYVDPRRYRILSQLQWSPEQKARLTTNPQDTCLWVVPLGHINMQRLHHYRSISTKQFTKQFDRVVGFRPTGWTHSPKSKSKSVVNIVHKGNIVVCGVPYSEHSSFPELVDCIHGLQPRIIIPTVSVGRSQKQVDILLKALREGKTLITED
jgi:DNA cross-link repair 1A protein